MNVKLIESQTDIIMKREDNGNSEQIEITGLKIGRSKFKRVFVSANCLC